ncbi:GRB2-associated-binding protein 3 isoform X2 [Zerene cesonia]|uniref:GRB2-associated-binding protein 3 isoform X2 n=1 Tax=Zerene cesonia TaxID=33412 RepID=UPI0018E57DEA|nr:GRB2-associated-binding protein 3 isoform X2 [Zerene cesonia]
MSNDPLAKYIVLEGWLTKSPPSRRIFKTKWRRRWFILRQSGELPGQYYLEYFSDRNRRRIKGSINLDLCEQVDAGLHMSRSGNGILNPRMRGCVFSLQTHTRTFHMEADCESEMEKWVDAICRVCGLRPTCRPPAEVKKKSWSLARSYVRPGPQDRVYAIRASTSGNNPSTSSNQTERNPLGVPRRLEVTEEGPPVPPRPPKTIGLNREHRESFQGPRLQEPEFDRSQPFPWMRPARPVSHAATQSVPYRPRTEDEEECCLSNSLQQYCNLTSLPPIVDRALKPRISVQPSTSVGHVNQVGQVFQLPPQPSTSRAPPRRASDVLQYLDLDLSSPKSPTKNQDGVRRVHHAKSFSAESRADYKTVDFVKTEAFNITRQDAEASRSVQQ